MAQIIEISPQQFAQLNINDNLLLCDIREPDEHLREWIAQAINVPLSSFHHDDLAKLTKEKTLVFYCQSGNRTKMNASKFANLNCATVYILTGGINEWKQAGYPTQNNEQAPLPIMRQVQISAGCLILLSVLLAYFIHPAFILISAFVGAGLVFAGASGYCGMANLLMLLPYNKRACNTHCQQK